MIAEKLCLSLSLLATQNAMPPKHVDELVQTRIIQQHRAQGLDQDVELKFNAPECSKRGSYYYVQDSVVIALEGDQQRGQINLNIVDVLDGLKIDFSGLESNRIAQVGKAIELPPPLFEKEPSKSLWAEPMGRAMLGGIAGATGGALFSPNAESRPLNALVFGAVGALTGALLRFEF